MKENYKNFSEYMNSSKDLFIQLFGKDAFNQLESIAIKPIDYKGVDIDCCNITATFPNVKERFNEDWVEYFKEHERTAFDLFLQTVFHFGYNQCYDYEATSRKTLNLIERLSGKLKSQKT